MMGLGRRIYRYRRKCAGWLWGAHAYRGILSSKLMLDRPQLQLRYLQIDSDMSMHRHREHPCHMPCLARWDDLLGFSLWVPD